MEKLKPCPFCDSKEMQHMKNYRTHIRCIRCEDSIDCPHEATQCLHCDAVVFGAIKAWNRRVQND